MIRVIGLGSPFGDDRVVGDEHEGRAALLAQVQEQLEELIPGARLVGTRGFGRAVIRHMADA